MSEGRAGILAYEVHELDREIKELKRLRKNKKESERRLRLRIEGYDVTEKREAIRSVLEHREIVAEIESMEADIINFIEERNIKATEYNNIMKEILDE